MGNILMRNNLLNRKESIILTAVEIVSELGIQGLTTREIAARQGISEGTIFRHFKNKSEIFLSMLDHFSQFDMDIMDSLRIKKLQFRDAIRYYVTSYVEYYQHYPEISCIAYTYDGLMNEAVLQEKVKNVFDSRFNFIKQLINEGKKTGEVPVSVDSEGLASIIDGSFRIVLLQWRMNHYKFPLKERVLSIIDMILEAFAM